MRLLYMYVGILEYIPYPNRINIITKKCFIDCWCEEDSYSVKRITIGVLLPIKINSKLLDYSSIQNIHYMFRIRRTEKTTCLFCRMPKELHSTDKDCNLTNKIRQRFKKLNRFIRYINDYNQ
jgi:hypothetical protein